MAVNIQAVKESAVSPLGESNGEVLISEQMERTYDGCAIILTHILGTLFGLGLVGVGAIGDESSLKLLGGVITSLVNVWALIEYGVIPIPELSHKD